MRKILLVEDEADIRDPFTIVLRSNGYSVDVAVDGKDALNYCSEKSYDLILLDLMMPDLDGVGFLKEAFAEDIPSGTRIVLLTNLSSGTLLHQGLDFGAHNHEIKSNLTPASLLKLVESELEKLEVTA